jgi:hypothetical protein
MAYYRCETSTSDKPCQRTRSRCSECLLAFYCSPECQLADWESHEQICACAKAAQKLLRGDTDSRAVCKDAREALALIPSGAERLDAAISLLLAQLSHERPHAELVETAEKELSALAERLPAGPELAVAAALLEVIYCRTELEYGWKNTREQRRQLEQSVCRLEHGAAAAAAAGDRRTVATAHFLYFTVSYLRSQYWPRGERRNLYWKALVQSRRYADAWRELVSAGELAPRALYDVWNPLARMVTRARMQIMEYEQEFVEACREWGGSEVDPTDGIFETVAEFEKIVNEGLQFLAKGKNRYAIALLHWHSVVFFSKLADSDASPADRLRLDRSRELAARAGLVAARRIAHAPLKAAFAAELGRECSSNAETETEAETNTEAEAGSNTEAGSDSVLPPVLA